MLIYYLFYHLQEPIHVIIEKFFLNYYVPDAEIKDFNVLIDRKRFFDLPVKNEEEGYENIIEMSNNNDYTIGNLLDFAYFKKHYKLISIDLSKIKKPATN